MTERARQVSYYVVADWLSTSLAVLLFNISRYSLLSTAKAFYSLGDYLSAPTVLAGQILFPLGMLFVYYLSGYYVNTVNKSRVEEFTATLGTAFIGTLVIIFVALINDLTNDRSQDYRVFFIVFVLLFVLVYIPRLIITTIITRRISAGKISFPTAIVGPGTQPELFDEFMQSRMPKLGLKPSLRLYTDGVKPSSDTLPADFVDNAREACRRHGINRILVIPHPDGWERTLEIVNSLYVLDMPIYVSVRRLPSHLFAGRLVSFTADPLIDMSHSHLPPVTLCVKRSFDVVVSAVMMALLAIPVGLLAVAVKIDSPGPAFFRQPRVGFKRKLFTIYKLRTMCSDAEPDGKPRLSSPNDPRITRLGRILRKYRLDELPQFYNVFRGDMSIVGPRPERMEYVEQIEKVEPSYALIHRLRPGITSLAMVKYGYASSLPQMVDRMRYDLMYLQNVSILSDVKILLYTFVTVFSGRGI